MDHNKAIVIYILHNLLAILAATLAGLAIGLVWLRSSRILLPGWETLIFAAMAEFWLAAFLAGAIILAPNSAGEWEVALGSAFVIWIGVVLPVMGVTFMVNRMPSQSAMSACAHWLIVIIVQASILQAIGLTGP